ncbi:MAG TPA: Fic family protein [Gemmatimonadaceae bacterium]|nr:Fic family protein [Gemmatimonadaceae bacterium]
MHRGSTGRLVTTTSVGGERVRAFIPHPLPPDPPLALDGDLRDVLDSALLALGRLDSVTTLLPDTRLSLYTYVRKEAVLSSQIEGTQSSLADLLAFEANEAPGVPLDDVVEVSHHVAALEHGLQRVRDGFPLSSRLLREVHAILLRGGRGAEQEPGEFRRSQNWIGGTRPGNAVFVPPPPEQVPESMGALERWLHDEPERTSTLLKAALAHAQFETIHPFLDGNGRVGRLLVTLLLCVEGVLSEPLLYLSLYLKQHRADYYDLLGRVRTEGDWETWVRFFAEGVRETAAGAVATAQRLVRLFQEDRARIQAIGRAAGSALRVHEALQERPLDSAAGLAGRTGLSTPAVNAMLTALQELGVVREITGRRRNRLFSYEQYLRILNEGAEPLG